MTGVRAGISPQKARLPLVNVSGIESADSAFAKIRAGASLLQLCTGLLYEGLGLLAGIKRG
jgi:dihydroorotate dehydrogenase